MIGSHEACTIYKRVKIYYLHSADIDIQSKTPKCCLQKKYNKKCLACLNLRELASFPINLSKTIWPYVITEYMQPVNCLQ